VTTNFFVGGIDFTHESIPVTGGLGLKLDRDHKRIMILERHGSFIFQLANEEDLIWLVEEVQAMVMAVRRKEVSKGVNLKLRASTNPATCSPTTKTNISTHQKGCGGSMSQNKNEPTPPGGVSWDVGEVLFANEGGSREVFLKPRASSNPGAWMPP
jgi:hypothetical protein